MTRGPGWTRDANHFPRRITPWFAGRMVPVLDDALRAAFADCGLLLDGLAHRVEDGLVYVRPRPIGAPAGATRLPPRWAFRLAMALHPEVRRRVRRLEATIAARRWRDDVARWDAEARPAALARRDALRAIAPDALDDRGLRAHLVDCDAAAREMMRVHHAYDPAAILPTAIFLAKARGWTGLPLAVLLGLFAGASPASAGAIAAWRALGEAVRADAGAAAALAGCSGEAAAEAAAEAVLAGLRAGGGAVAAALAAVEAEAGDRILDGYDVDGATLSDLPGLMVARIRAAAGGGAGAAVDAAGAAARAEAVRARVPAAERAAFDDWLAEARAAYRLRDERSVCTDNWAFGLMRRAMRALGRRLAAAGRLRDPAHVFEAGWDEILALADGAGPDADDLAGRAIHRAAPRPEPPNGPPIPAPPDEWLPAGAMRLVMPAVKGYMDAMFDVSAARGDRATCLGLAASAGVAEGTARVILDPAALGAVRAGDVLVARNTGVAYNAILPMLAAVVTDQGGPLAHAAIVARELGVPAVVGTSDATWVIPDGARVRVDGTTGVVTVLG